MQSEILQKFLDRGLLSLGEGTDKFNYVTSAAADLANSLKEDRRKLVRGSLILVGDNLDEREPLLDTCDEAIKKYWPTYRGRFKSNTTQLFRATLLQAIAEITKDESTHDYSGIVFYTTCGYPPYLTAEGEDDIVREFLVPLGKTVEVEALRLWGSTKNLGVSTVQYGEVGVAAASIDVKALKDQLKAAAGNVGTNPNPNSIGSAEWLEHFGQNAANAISAALAQVLAEVISQGRTDGEASLAEINGIFNNFASDNRGAEILYWKESLFSVARSASYRRMSPNAAVYWAAWDLHNLVPRFHPLSAEYFLRETIRAAIGMEEATKELTSMDFCRELAQTPQSIVLQHAMLPNQSFTLLEAVQATAAGHLDVQYAAARTGIPHKSLIPREELAVWLFRDMQVSRLVGDR